MSGVYRIAIDLTCLIHGKKWSEHEGGRCLYCSLCFEPLTPEQCATDADGVKWDICEECWVYDQAALQPKSAAELTQPPTGMSP